MSFIPKKGNKLRLTSRWCECYHRKEWHHHFLSSDSASPTGRFREIHLQVEWLFHYSKATFRKSSGSFSLRRKLPQGNWHTWYSVQHWNLFNITFRIVTSFKLDAILDKSSSGSLEITWKWPRIRLFPLKWASIKLYACRLVEVVD